MPAKIFRTVLTGSSSSSHMVCRVGDLVSSGPTGGRPPVLPSFLPRCAMTRRALLTATVACFLVAAPATRCLTGPEPTQQQRKAPPSERAIAEWIRQLSDDHFAVREAAQRALVEAGPPALPAVRAAARSGDAEVRRRAAAILQAIGAQIASRKPAVKVPLADAKTQVELHQSLALRLY